MSEEYRIAWIIYASGVLMLLAAGWWFMRNWGWAWLRRSLLLITASVLLVPAQGTFQGGPPAPVLPLFVYQTLFEDGAKPEVAANLVFAAAGALAVLLLAGLIFWALARRRDRELMNSEPFFDD
jgi:hypothetical protein